MKRFRILFGAFVGLLCAVASPANAAQSTPEGRSYLAPVPNWVTPSPVSLDASVPPDASDGEYHLLVERQYRVTGMQEDFYYHTAIRITGQAGVQSNGRVEISYDPDSQKAEIYSVRIIRDGRVIDQLDSVRIDVLRREEDLDKSIIDGHLTVNLVLEDIRVGDVLEYSYGLIEDMTDVGGVFSARFSVNWSVPVAEVTARVLWPANRELRIKNHETGIQPVVSDAGEHKSYVWSVSGVQALDYEDEIPSSYTRWGWVQLSSTASWAEVVAMERPFYESAISHSSEVEAIAASIVEKRRDDQGRVIEALHYVQDRIRYTGLSLGRHSYVPHTPVQVLKRGYGDCKDKSTLLVAILREMGIAANVALVDTEVGRKLDTFAPTPWAFDHAIVEVRLDGATYWLDPTGSNQGATLATVVQSDLGFALPLRSGVDGLVAMPRLFPERPDFTLYETLTVPRRVGETVSLKVESVSSGVRAESMRRYLVKTPLADVQRAYVNDYASRFPDIEPAAPLSVDDNRDANVVTVNEYYEFPRTAEFLDGLILDAYVANEIFNKPETVRRTSPFAVPAGINRHHIIEVVAPDLDLHPPRNAVIDGPAFHFTLKTVKTVNGFIASHYIRSKSDRVEPADIATYLRNIDRLNDISYHVRAEFTADAGGIPDDQLEMLILGGVFLIIAAFMIGGLVYGLRADRDIVLLGIYFPVAAWKFVLMGVVTLGVYQFFWVWKSWRWVRIRDESTIWPFWRAVFGPFWAPALVSDMNRRFPEQRLAVFWGWAVLVVEVLATVVQAVFRDSIWIDFGSVIVTVALWLPLAMHVIKLNGTDNEAYRRYRTLNALNVAWLVIFGVFIAFVAIGLSM